MTTKELRLEAHVIQQRIDRRTVKGIAVTSDMVWTWIRERHPTWSQTNQEAIFQRVRF